MALRHEAYSDAPMTRPSPDLIWKVGLALVAGGIAWATLTAAVRDVAVNKLDTSRFVADSIARAAQQREDDRDMQRLERKVDAIGCRVVPQSFECP